MERNGGKEWERKGGKYGSSRMVVGWSERKRKEGRKVGKEEGKDRSGGRKERRNNESRTSEEIGGH
jgi:hypothetical protein